jgi:hypothetical protein
MHPNAKQLLVALTQSTKTIRKGHSIFEMLQSPRPFALHFQRHKRYHETLRVAHIVLVALAFPPPPDISPAGSL